MNKPEMKFMERDGRQFFVAVLNDGGEPIVVDDEDGMDRHSVFDAVAEAYERGYARGKRPLALFD